MVRVIDVTRVNAGPRKMSICNLSVTHAFFGQACEYQTSVCSKVKAQPFVASLTLSFCLRLVQLLISLVGFNVSWGKMYFQSFGHFISN